MSCGKELNDSYKILDHVGTRSDPLGFVVGGCERQHLQFLPLPLPDVKMLDVNKLKAFADDNLNIAKMTISHFDRVEYTVGKGLPFVILQNLIG